MLSQIVKNRPTNCIWNRDLLLQAVAIAKITKKNL